MIPNDLFANRQTSIAYNYLKNNLIKGNIEELKQHIKMLSIESGKKHPFIGSCVIEVVNNIDWDFIELHCS